jgi:hypothetical protein
VGSAEGAVVVLGMLGGEVIVLCSCIVVLLEAVVVVTSSLHPQNRPGVKHVVLVAVGVVDVVVLVVVVVVLSLQPNQPLNKVSAIIYYTASRH